MTLKSINKSNNYSKHMKNEKHGNDKRIYKNNLILVTTTCMSQIIGEQQTLFSSVI